jgi:hypothetical protein
MLQKLGQGKPTLVPPQSKLVNSEGDSYTTRDTAGPTSPRATSHRRTTIAPTRPGRKT